MLNNIVCLAALLLVFQNSAVAQPGSALSYVPQGEQQLRNMMVVQQADGSEKVFVGSSNSLVRLGSSLVLESESYLQSLNRMLVDVEMSGQRYLLTCQMYNCTFFEQSDLDEYFSASSPPGAGEDTILPGNRDIAVEHLAGQNQFFVGRRPYPDAFVTSIISKLMLKEDHSITVVGIHAEQNAFRDRVFLHSFSNDKFVYFVFRLTNSPMTSSLDVMNELRIARICKSDEGVDAELTTYTEALLECSMPSEDYFSASSVTVNGNVFVISAGYDMSFNRLCLFSLAEIDQAMNIKLNSCRDGEGFTQLKRDTSNECPSFSDPAQIELIQVCNRVGSLRQPLETEEPVSSVSLLNFPSGNRISALTVTEISNVTFVYAGGMGEVIQFFLSSTQLLTRVRNIPLEEGLDQAIDELHISEDGEFFYALTQGGIFKLVVDRCSTYKSCDECTGFGDPICGWCTVSGFCSRRKDCASEPMIWVQDSSACPKINAVTPAILYTHQLSPSTTVNLNVSNIPDLNYDCVYSFDKGQTVTKTVVTTENVEMDSIICRVPSRSDVPSFTPGVETQFATLSLRAGGVDVVTVNGSDGLGFTNCSALSNCISCLNSDHNCQWCPMETVCMSPEQTCDFVALNGSSDDSCPVIDMSDQTDGNYLIHTHISTRLAVRARNLDVFGEGSFYCVISNGSAEFYHLEGVWSKENGTVTCEMNMFTDIQLSEDMPMLVATLEIRWQNSEDTLSIENPQDAKAVFYSCPELGQDCGQCLSIGSLYPCGYCHNRGSCLINSECNTGQFHTSVEDISECGDFHITSFTPARGPTQGGTMVTISGNNLGADASHVSMVWIGEVFCTHKDQQYIPGRRVVCETEESVRSENDVITITFTFANVSSTDKFSFLNAALNRPVAFPNIGPASGGTRVIVMGENLDIGSSRTIELEGKECLIEDGKITSANITCVTTPGSAGDQENIGNVKVNIDTHTLVRSGFNYVSDPTFGGISPGFSFIRGGTDFFINGTNLDSVLKPRLRFYVLQAQTNVGFEDTMFISSEPCERVPDSAGRSMICLAPDINSLFSGSDLTVRIGLEMDGVQNLLSLDQNVTVHMNPSFKNLTDPVEVVIGFDAVITIEYSGYDFLADQLMVDIEESDYECEYLENSSPYQCMVTVPSMAVPGNFRITVVLGYQRTVVGSLVVVESFDALDVIIPVFIGLVLLGVAIFIVVISVMYRKYKLKDEQNDRLLLELGRLEASVAHECKLGFAELQTDLDELTGDLAGTRLPYQDFRVYIMQCLFPGVRDHPVLHDIEVPSHRRTQVEKAVHDFHSLVQNKTVLLTMIHALERQRGFSIRDKSTFGSLLMVVLHDKLDYATEILKRLMSDLVRRTVAESYPKLLLRRTESVAEKMLSSWLAFTLHGYVVEHVGQPMYLLFKAVKAQLEKGPIDVITGEARYSLSEQKLIRQQMDVRSLSVTVEADNGAQHLVKLLDCDSISQVKEKMMDVVYKGVPVSQRPPLTSVDVEFHHSPRETYLLRDEDDTNYVENGWRRINTLNHYRIPDHAVFKLVPRKQQPSPGKTFDYMGIINVNHGTRHRTISETDVGTRVWHLFKQVEEDLHASPFVNKKMVTEIYLPRMLSTKTILQKFVDDMFNSIFTLTHPPSSPSHLYTPIGSVFPSITASQLSYAPDADSLPVAIKYLFDFLDEEAISSKISDTDVVHMWKNNSIALRFWVNLIKNPEFVFDISKSATVDACLSVIAQAFIDGCSSSDFKPTINSPTSKLLYNKEVQGYKASVKTYYEEIQMLDRVSDDMMMQYLRELSSYQQQLLRKSGGFHVKSALHEILRYVVKYQLPIVEALRSSGLESKATLLESIVGYVS